MPNGDLWPNVAKTDSQHCIKTVIFQRKMIGSEICQQKAGIDYSRLYKDKEAIKKKKRVMMDESSSADPAGLDHQIWVFCWRMFPSTSSLKFEELGKN